MAIIKYQTPFGLMNDLRKEINRIFDYGYNPEVNNDGQSFSSWCPLVDIKEENDKYLVLADIPGVDSKDIKISVDNSTLTIQGERKLESNEEKDNYKKIERIAGNFCRKFYLPQNIDGNQIDAKFKNGVLEVIIPKMEAATTKYIEVKSGD